MYPGGSAKVIGVPIGQAFRQNVTRRRPRVQFRRLVDSPLDISRQIRQWRNENYLMKDSADIETDPVVDNNQ